MLELRDQSGELAGPVECGNVGREGGVPSGAREQLERERQLVEEELEVGGGGAEVGPRACRAGGVQEERRAFAQEAAGEGELVAPTRLHDVVLARPSERIELANQRLHARIMDTYDIPYRRTRTHTKNWRIYTTVTTVLK